MPQNKLGNGPLVALVLGTAMVSISGFGEHSPLLRLSVMFVALATWLAIEAYSRQITRLAYAWEQFLAPAMAKSRTTMSGVILFTSAYIMLSTYFNHGDRVRASTGVQLAFLISGLSFLWFSLEMINLKQNLELSRPAAKSPVPESFPGGYLFQNLKRLAGESASADAMLEVARGFSTDSEWLHMCRAIIARNMPESALSLLGTQSFGWYGDDVWIDWGDAETKVLYERLVRATGLTNPTRQQLLAVVDDTFDNPAERMLCVKAIRAHLPQADECGAEAA